MTAIFRLLPRPIGPPVAPVSAPIDHPTSPTGKLIPMDPSRRTSAPFDPAAMTTVERTLLAYVLRGKPLIQSKHASLVRLCRTSTSGE